MNPEKKETVIPTNEIKGRSTITLFNFISFTIA